MMWLAAILALDLIKVLIEKLSPAVVPPAPVTPLVPPVNPYTPGEIANMTPEQQSAVDAFVWSPTDTHAANIMNLGIRLPDSSVGPRGYLSRIPYRAWRKQIRRDWHIENSYNRAARAPPWRA